MPAPRSLLTRTCHPCLCRRGVIGGGIIGASASYYPARRVVKVALLERAGSARGRRAATGVVRSWTRRLMPLHASTKAPGARSRISDA